MRGVLELMLVVGLVAGGAAQSGPVYPVTDATVDIAAAQAASRRDGKHVLLDFGADWCPDCRVLDILLKDPAVAPFVAVNFHVVRIDVGRRDRNAELVEQYKATSGEWIPALVALDPGGTVIGVTNTDVRVSRKTTPNELLALLQRWAPKERVASLGSFRQHGVQVEFWLERTVRGSMWVAAVFRPLTAGVHLYGATLPMEGIDGLGRPTRLTLQDSLAWRVAGPAVADRTEQDYRFDVLPQIMPVYPPGPVTLRVPVELRTPALQGSATITYMGCSEDGCLPPVVERRVVLQRAAAGR
jgi:protein disulfide-isomerase